MRKLIVALILLIVVGGAIAFIVYRNLNKPVPTVVGWKAYVTTVAGDGSPLGLSDPFGVAVGTDGSIYMTDAGEQNRIQRIAPDGSVTSIAGGVEGYGDGDNAQFNSPSGGRGKQSPPARFDPWGNVDDRRRRSCGIRGWTS